MNGLFWVLIGSAIGMIFSLVLAIIGYMTKESALLIAGITLFFSSVTLTVGGIITYFATKDNYKTAIFFMTSGKHTTKFNGNMLREDRNAVIYIFGNKQTITVPHNYGLTFLDHKRRIEIDENYGLIYPKDKKVLPRNEYGNIVKELTLDHLGADIVHAVKGKQMNWIMIAIIAFCAGILITVVATMLFSKQKQPVTQPQQPAIIQPTPTQQLPPSNIIVPEGK